MNAARTEKRLAVLAGLLLASVGAATPVHAAPPVTAQADWRKIKPAAMRPFQPQQPVRIQLDNGMVVFLQQDTEVPLVRMSCMVRGGSRDEPADRVGLVDVFGQAWRTGGTKSRTGDQLDEFLGVRAATIESGGSLEFTSLSTVSLKQDFDTVLGAFVELLREPEFRQDKIDLAKRRVYTGIARRNDDPMGITRRESQKLAYGAAHPYARQIEYSTVAAITRDDLVKWHKQYVAPNNIILGVSGDFDPKEMEQKLRAALSGWGKGPAAQTNDFAFTPTKSGLFFVAKDDVNQSNIHLVQLGTTRKSPDYYALEVMNEVLGGGFAARLFSNVRSKKGLAYSVGGGVGMGWTQPAVYRLAVGTASKNTVSAIQALYEEVQGMLSRPPSTEELQKAKDALLNSFVFRFDSKMNILRDRMNLEFNGYPLDFTEKYPAAIEKVTLDDVNRVAKKYLNPGGFAVLVVGNPTEVGNALSQLGGQLGTVNPLDIAIPAPPAGSMGSPRPAPGTAPAPAASGGATNTSAVGPAKK